MADLKNREHWAPEARIAQLERDLAHATEKLLAQDREIDGLTDDWRRIRQQITELLERATYV